jgi:hypothetical protein
MAVLSFPVVRVAALGRTLKTATVGVRSPFTGQEQVQDWGGSWWSYEVEMAVTTGGEARALSAFFTALGGKRNTFTFADPKAGISGAFVAGQPRVDGSGQSGSTLVTAGWDAGRQLVAGDTFSLGTGAAARLYMLTADALTNSQGRATLQIVPPLRSSPANNAPIEAHAPLVHLRLSSPVPTQMDLADVFRFSFTAEEAL